MALDAQAQVLFVLAIAGGVAANYFQTPLNVGETLSAAVPTGFNPDIPCYLESPKGDVIEFRPANNSTDRITYVQTDFISYCGANVASLTEEDNGEWTIYYLNGTERIGNTYNLTVTKDEEVPIQWLRDFAISTRTGQSVNIALSKREDSLQETFSIINNQDEVLPLNNRISGVTVQGGSGFVANRITIGPMSESLLGRWTLCGETSRDRRCQSVDIVWSNINNPSQEWNTTTAYQRDIVTNNLAVVDASVRGAGGLLTCHIITPSGDDITVNSDSTYSGIKFKPVRDSNLCTVSLGPIREEFIGEWTIYAQFMSNTLGRNEVRSPLRIQLGDEEDTPSQVYDVSTLNPLSRIVSLGTTTTLSMSGKGSTDSCEIRSPSGDLFDLQSSSDTVVFLSTEKKVRCRVEIGPIVKDKLGDWLFIVRFSYKGRFIENRQTVSLVLEDEEDLSQGYDVSTLNPLTRMVSLGTSTTLTLSGKGSTDSCEIRSPSGESFDLQSNSDTVTFLSTDKTVRCRVEIGPIGVNTLGDWLFIVRFSYKGRFIENRQTVSLVLEENELLSEIRIATRTGRTVDISLGKIELNAKEEKFTLTTPSNQVVPLENANIPGVMVHGRSEFVDSRVTIGPMSSSLIGRWTLCGEVNVPSSVKRCQPVVISWNDVDNPSNEWNTTVLARRDTVTNYLATVNTFVRGSGALQSCHLITPQGEDLVLNSDSVYPGLGFVSNRDTSICSVTLGPIHQQFIGEWTLYATYIASRGGMNEVHMPLNLFLYDKENPYSQAYNVTTQNTLTRVINLGNTLNFDLSGSGNTDSCEIRSPTGQLYNMQNANGIVTFLSPNSNLRCRVTLGPLQSGNLGDWTFIAKFNNRGIFTEIRQPISILLEDPENPIIEDHRTVILRDPIYLVSSVGEEHTINADPSTSSRDVTESCHIRTPNGLQYIIMEGFNLPGIQLVPSSNNRCIISVHIESLDFIGEWTLISREQRSSQPVEVRQTFTIFIEENVDASVSQVTVAEGNDLFVRLAKPTNRHDSCKLYDPSGTERTNRDVDPNYIDTCGFVVRNVQSYDSGMWQIRYKDGITYTADISVIVKDQWDWEASQDTLTLTQGHSINKTIGPERAVYCKLTDPSARVVFEGHGRCVLALDRVASHHIGTWVMNVGFRGNMLARSYNFEVEARSSDKPVVTTMVTKEQPQVTLKCSVPVEYDVESCLFQDPSGRVIIVNDGVAEDKYISHGSGTTVRGDVTTHECGIRIMDPSPSDLGLWRCAVETKQEVYYGFLEVLCPWAMQDPEVAAAVVSEPTLEARKETISILDTESLTMSCSIQSPIRYCYFRRSNGMTYSVSPGTSSEDYEYVGAGLDAGECGIRFSTLPTKEPGHWQEGRWSCHVGLPNGTQPEQRANIQVHITNVIEVNQHVSGGVLTVEADVYHNQPLEYCRYVRMDGTGFTSEHLPDNRYWSNEDLKKGHCGISIENPTDLESHPWTVAAKIKGKNEEVMDITNHTFDMPDAMPNPEQNPGLRKSSNIWLWFVACLLGAVLISASILLLPRKNRNAFLYRAASFRDSVRRSFSKKPLFDEPLPRTKGSDDIPVIA